MVDNEKLYTSAADYLTQKGFPVTYRNEELFVDDEDESIELPAEELNRRQIAGFVRGLEQALNIPSNFERESWDFADAAGAMVPVIENQSLVEGFYAVTGESPIRKSFFEDLSIFYQIEIRGGTRLVTESLMDEWSATMDQVDSAARSILYHKTQNRSSSPVADREFVHQFALSDGYNASRSLILCDVFYHSFGTSNRLTMPTNEILLYVEQPQKEALEELEDVTAEIYERTAIPLSSSIYQFNRRGEPEPIKE